MWGIDREGRVDLILIIMGNCEMCDREKEREVEQDMTQAAQYRPDHRVGIYNSPQPTTGGVSLLDLTNISTSANPKVAIQGVCTKFRNLTDLKSLINAIESYLCVTALGTIEAVSINKMFEAFLDANFKADGNEDKEHKEAIQRAAESVLKYAYIVSKHPKEVQNKVHTEVGTSITSLKTTLKPQALELGYVAVARGEYERILESIGVF